MSVNRRIEFQTISDFRHYEVRLNFGNNEKERKRLADAQDLLDLVAKFNIKGFIMGVDNLEGLE